MTTAQKVLSTCDECGAQVFAAPTGQRPKVMIHWPDCTLAKTRAACDWCGGPMPENPQQGAETCQDRCRASRWKYRRGYGRSFTNLQAKVIVAVAEASGYQPQDGDITADALSALDWLERKGPFIPDGRAAAAVNGRANGARPGGKPSGLQVSYWKAVAAVEKLIDELRPDLVEQSYRRAEQALRPALSARQRARVEDRRG